MLQDLTTHIVGVDTHKDTHTVAIVQSGTGGVLQIETFDADGNGYQAAISFADRFCEAENRAWAIEGTASYGAGLSTQLHACGEWVIEVERPHRPRSRDGRKTDDIDAVRAARDALSSQQLASPRQRGDREALRLVSGLRESAVQTRTRTINQLKAVIISSPDDIRAKLRTATTPFALAQAVKSLRPKSKDNQEHTATIKALHQLAKRIRFLNKEIKEHDKAIKELTTSLCPEMVQESGVGPVTAATIYIGWSHLGRCRNESAFAMLSGTAPLEASSGKTTRHRLNRGGDRQINRALHTAVLSRAKTDQRTKDFIENHLAKGKTKKEIYRLLARYLARHLFRLLESTAQEKLAITP